MVKLIYGAAVMMISLAETLSAATVDFTPARERKFSGAKVTQQRQAEFAAQRLQRAAEKLSRSFNPSHEVNCSPNRLNVLTDARGKAAHKAKMITANAARAARLALK